MNKVIIKTYKVLVAIALFAAVPGYGMTPEDNSKKEKSKALISAVIYGKRPAMNKLLTEDATLVHCTDEHGRTPLHYAAWLGSMYISYDLLCCGASPEICDEKGKTPIDMALDKHTVNSNIYTMLKYGRLSATMPTETIDTDGESSNTSIKEGSK